MGKSDAPWQRDIADGLILRTVRDERDVERYVAAIAAVNGETESRMADRLLRRHPEAAYDNFLLVEDPRTGHAVSTTCLLPWRCRLEDVVLDVAMLEMVGTRPDYRHRGLIRAQVERFHHRVSERGYDTSIIQGIPYYYRQYSYAYALDHSAHDSLPAWRIPDRPKGPSSRYRLRPATVDDAAALARLYQDATAGLQLYTLRDTAYWQYLLQWAGLAVRVIEDLDEDRLAGYVCSDEREEGRGITVLESQVTGYEAGMAILRQLKAETGGEIRLGGPGTQTLARIGRSLGSTARPAYQWLLRITDVARFLLKIGPILERRLAASDCAGLTAGLCINLYRQAYVLYIQAGKLARVDQAGFVDASMGAQGGDLNIPPDAFVRLVLGYRDLDELHDAWPDTVARAESRHLFDVLFPRVDSWVHMPY
jgi:predicted N-acetyltransferase YhbS